MRMRICHSTLPLFEFERCCLGSLGILGVFGFKAGCFSAKGTCPFKGSFKIGPCFLLLSLSERDLEDEEFLLVAEDDDDEEDEDEEQDEEEETAADPPCNVALVTFLAVLGDPPSVAGMDLSESSVLDYFKTLLAFCKWVLFYFFRFYAISSGGLVSWLWLWSGVCDLFG